nr:immunoglobulin heavy chain junction region [Macaca mulatta]MOV54551.1 immunoglobulin heavy chain junction region [Macaca mulatta]MOV55563.1 immunoglobulin heavy chain junction region [Macaca mulatta]MOV55885.1 immunoglobulin heavy chain junction region [Macaca mulatta]MOV56785.1 immunoglobulin heavy chain junction region [Macaca mulatta]
CARVPFENDYAYYYMGNRFDVW